MVESRADVANVANTFEYYGSLAPFIYGETIPMPGNLFDFTLREPVGVCALIVPWNFPMLLAAWKIGPCLATGNTAILKPASNTPLGAVLLGQLALEAGLPDGVLNVVPGPGATVGRALCTHPDVDKIGFTGETVTGREILRLGADTIKKVTLELGGKSPNIVFPDADLSRAVQGSLPAIFGNAGQRCTARSRLFVHQRVHEEFVERSSPRPTRIRVGDPLDPDTQMGPLVSRSQVERVEGYIALGQDEGARVATGGRRPDGDRGSRRATICCRPSSMACKTRCASHRRRFSARSSRSSTSPRSTMSSARRTTSPMASARRSGRATSRSPSPTAPAADARATSRSTTRPSTTSTRRSAATSRAASGANWAGTASTSSRR